MTYLQCHQAETRESVGGLERKIVVQGGKRSFDQSLGSSNSDLHYELFQTSGFAL